MTTKVTLRQEERFLDEDVYVDQVLEIAKLDMDPNNVHYRPASTPTATSLTAGSRSRPRRSLRQIPGRAWLTTSSFKNATHPAGRGGPRTVEPLLVAVFVTRPLDSALTLSLPASARHTGHATGKPEQHGDSRVELVEDSFGLDMGYSVVSGLQSMMVVLQGGVLQPSAPLLGTHRTHGFAKAE
ncbi:hypothetical protein CONLIGDRAFT_718672 [Coniochaeta ligniaria NRRL 30616]|uniref:Uncharacterized protein n=1 Tax=Coniochaeta ligniaria NRRL 30616 TaxID=1408157 RepID=A0A1J7I963_9PEZI|nr:hypothetical protein CONLIGDRAFT_718672 [Coniochaeta ligniaria NRRL 30616]